MSPRGGKSTRTNFEPKAYLRNIINVKPGLIARTAVIRAMGHEWKSAGKMSKETHLSYKVVVYHLQLMRNEGIVTYKSKRPRLWRLTGLGQQTIV